MKNSDIPDSNYFELTIDESPEFIQFEPVPGPTLLMFTKYENLPIMSVQRTLDQDDNDRVVFTLSDDSTVVVKDDEEYDIDVWTIVKSL